MEEMLEKIEFRVAQWVQARFGVDPTPEANFQSMLDVLYSDFERFKLVHDNDGHQYVIPSLKSGEWWAWLEEADNDLPEWARRVDGHFSFLDPEVRVG